MFRIVLSLLFLRKSLEENGCVFFQAFSFAVMQRRLYESRYQGKLFGRCALAECVQFLITLIDRLGNDPCQQERRGDLQVLAEQNK